MYVAWQDCRFHKNCTADDIVFSTSSEGVDWSDPARIPIDDVASNVDHFIPGLAVDSTTSGAGTHLALTYYFYPNADCGSSCRLEVGSITSPDGGAHWGDPTQLAGSSRRAVSSTRRCTRRLRSRRRRRRRTRQRARAPRDP